jgi:cytochrome oxidase Cu insertion factor (SCO1/SenC/PrrC family)
MTSRRLALLLLVGLAVVALAGGSAPAPAADKDKVLDDLLFELQLIPMAGQEPPAFELEKLIDGKKVTLAELRGRPVLLYFWATW